MAIGNVLESVWDEEVVQKNTADSGVMFSEKILSDGTRYVQLDGDLFKNSDGKEMTPREAYHSLVGMPITLNDGDVVTLVDRLPGSKDMFNELFRRFPKFHKGINIKLVNNEINRNIIETLTSSDSVHKNIPDF